MSGSDLCTPRNETEWPHYFQSRIIMFFIPISTIMYLWIYIFPGSVCLFGAHRQMKKVGIGNKATQIHFWEYINRIFGTVCCPYSCSPSRSSCPCWSTPRCIYCPMRHVLPRILHLHFAESAFSVTKADPGREQYNEGLSVPDLGTPLTQ
jgi:hypothetical protein